MIKVITPTELDELRQLYAELPVAIQRAADALYTEPPGHVWDEAASARFLPEDAKVSAIIRRIHEITGS